MKRMKAEGHATRQVSEHYGVASKMRKDGINANKDMVKQQKKIPVFKWWYFADISSQ